MATHISHASLPYPVKNARFTVLVPYLDSTGTPTDPTTPDTEVSQDGGAFADAAEEVTTISGSNGCGYVTLSGAETNNSAVAVAFKVTSGPKATLMTLYPRLLPIEHSGTASAGASGTITLASDAAAIDDYYNGCIIRTTGGTGGGGTGGANNQARVITDYAGSTKVATVVPNWETTPSSDTTYDVLLTEVACNALRSHIMAAAALAAATANKIADHCRRRTQANVEASSDGDTLSLGSEYGMIQQMQESNLTASPGSQTVYKTDGTTSLGTKTVTADAAADPITGIS